MKLWILIVIAAAAAGCRIDVESGQLRCSVDGGLCPRGFHCAFDDTCWRDGVDPPAPADFAGDLAGLDLYGFDLDPKRDDGARCTSNGECASAICTSEGVCCDTKCESPCESCKTTAATGKCTRISGVPVAGRACGSGVCAGYCDGASSLCTFPPASAKCGAACDGQCNGAGACSSMGGSGCPEHFVCGPTACLTSCTQKSDCEGQYVCVNAQCVLPPETDCFDGEDNNGDGKADCADDTCVPSKARCVALPVDGAQLGVNSAAMCAAGSLFPMLSLLHRGLVQPVCTGCGCSSYSTCTYTMDLYAGAFCSNQLPAFADVGLKVVYPKGCATMAPFAGTSGQIQSLIIQEAFDPVPLRSCVTNNTAVKAPPSWMQSTTFCRLDATPRSKGCAANQVCVPLKPQAPLCLRYEGMDRTCPLGYTATPVPSSGKDWYTSFSDPTTCVCGDCDNVGATDQCPATIPAWNAYAGAFCAGARSLTVGAGMHGCRMSLTGTSPLQSAMFANEQPELSGQKCNVSTSINGTAAPTSTSRSTVCCE